MLEVILFVLGLVIGLVSGCIVARFLCTPKHGGNLCVYKDESGEGTSLFLELEESADNLSKGKYAIFRIKEIR